MRATDLAIMSSSLVRMTRTLTRLPAGEITGAFLALRLRSILIPREFSPSQIRARMSGAFSPSCARIQTQYRRAPGTRFSRFLSMLNMVASIQLHALAGSLGRDHDSSGESVRQLRGCPIAQVFCPPEREGVRFKAFVLCSLGVEVRQSRAARRFCFWNRNFHVVCFLSARCLWP